MLVEQFINSAPAFGTPLRLFNCDVFYLGDKTFSSSDEEFLQKSFYKRYQKIKNSKINTTIFFDTVYVPQKSDRFFNEIITFNHYSKILKKTIPQLKIIRKLPKIQLSTTKSTIYDLSEYATYAVKQTRSKKTVVEHLSSKINAMISDVKNNVKLKNKENESENENIARLKIILIDIPNIDDVGAQSLLDLLVVYAKMNKQSLPFMADAVLFFYEDLKKKEPLFYLIAKKDESDKNNKKLKLNIAAVNNLYKMLNRPTPTEVKSIFNEFQSDRSEVILHSAEKIRDYYSQLKQLQMTLEKSNKSALASVNNSVVNASMTKGVNYITAQIESLKELIKRELQNNIYLKSSSIERKISELFSEEEKIKNSKKTENEQQIRVNKKLTEKISEELSDRKNSVEQYSGVIEINENLLRKSSNSFYNPLTITKMNKFSGYARQRTELKETLDDTIIKLIQTFESDPQLKIKIKKITTSITDTDRDIFKTYNVTIQHRTFGYKKPYKISFHVPIPIHNKYFKLNGKTYIMINQFFPKPVIKVDHKTVRLYTHYGTLAVVLSGHLFSEQYGWEAALKKIEFLFKKNKGKVKIMKPTEEQLELILQKLGLDNVSLNHAVFTTVKAEQKNFKFSIDFNKTLEDENRTLFFEAEINGKSSIAYIEHGSEPFIEYIGFNNEKHRFPKRELKMFLIELLSDLFTYFGNSLNSHNSTLSKEFMAFFKKRVNSKTYFTIKILGKNIPLIHFFVVQFGLKKTLDYFKIKYSIDKKRLKNATISIRLSTKEYFSIYVDNFYKEYLVNGLFVGLKDIQPVDKNRLDDSTIYDRYLDSLKGKGYVRNLRKVARVFLDETTKDILKTYKIPDEFFKLIGIYMPYLLLNGAVEDHTDLSTQRIRMGEAIVHSAYKTIQQALGKMRNSLDAAQGTTFAMKLKNADSNMRLYIDSYDIVKRLFDSAMLAYIEPHNPLEEILTSLKIVKSGVGNMIKDNITVERRDLNPSYYGVISPIATNEYSNVGNAQTLTNGVKIKNRNGTIESKKFSDDVNPFEIIGPTEALMPFYEYDDTTRRVMGHQQFSQFIQLERGDEPLVQTGFESIVPYLTSDFFAIKAKNSGRVIKINDEFIVVRYDDGQVIKHSIKKRFARTKRGVYIPIVYNIFVKVNQKIKKDEILAATNSLERGKLTAGKNLVVAEMSYRGMNYEDGWVVSEKIKEKYRYKTAEKISILVPVGATITEFNLNKGNITKSGDVLLSYSYNEDDAGSIMDDNGESSIGGIEYRGNQVIYRSPGGQISEIVVTLNSKSVDRKIIKLYSELAKKIEQQKKECKKLYSGEQYVDCISNIQHSKILKIGEHKFQSQQFSGVLIEVFIEYDGDIDNGSKFTLAATGGKGTVQYIIPKDKTPIAEKTGLEIEFIPTPLSIISRKNISILLLMYSGKIVYFLNKKIKEMIKEKRERAIPEIRELLLEVFTVLDQSNDQFLINETMGFFDSKNPKEIVRYIADSDPLSYPAFPLLVPPHRNKIKIEHIEEAAKILDIPLNERVFIPEESTYTEKEVPVGIMPVIFLEHFPKAMSNSRGSLYTKRSYITGQGRAGTREGAGAIKMGIYDIFGISLREPGALLSEIMSIHADNPNARKQFHKAIIKSGGRMPSLKQLNLHSDVENSYRLINDFFNAALLDISLKDNKER